jgi:hypothetical protein
VAAQTILRLVDCASERQGLAHALGEWCGSGGWGGGGDMGVEVRSGVLGECEGSYSLQTDKNGFLDQMGV